MRGLRQVRYNGKKNPDRMHEGVNVRQRTAVTLNSGSTNQKCCVGTGIMM